MTMYYLNGGENIKEKQSFELNKKIFLEAGTKPVVFVFPWSKKLGFFDKYQELMESYFRECGASNVIFADENKPFEELKQEALLSDIIYLPGGNTEIFMDNAIQYKLKTILEEFTGTIIGNSAGTMILGEYAIGVPHDDERNEYTIIKGLGILPISTVVHYRKEFEKEVKEKSSQITLPVYCIPENQAVRIKGTKKELLGKDIDVIS